MKTLFEVEKGDKLILHGRFQTSEIATVFHTTPQYIELVGRQSKYRKKNGQLAGERSAWETNYITVPQEGEIDEIRNANRQKTLAVRLEDLKWREQSLETLEKVAAIINVSFQQALSTIAAQEGEGA